MQSTIEAFAAVLLLSNNYTFECLYGFCLMNEPDTSVTGVYFYFSLTHSVPEFTHL